MAAAAFSSVVHHAGMSELPGIAVMTLMVAASGEEAAAQSHANAQHDEVLHTVGTAKGIFPEG